MSTFSQESFPAENYKQFRPVHTEAFLGQLDRLHQGVLRKCLDVGTGTGQLAELLSTRIDQVLAVDPSATMLEAAIKKPNIVYKQARAEDLYQVFEADAGSIDLITVSQALHWFNVPDFLQQAYKLLRPGGSLIVLGYAYLFFPELESNSAVQDLSIRAFDEVWERGRELIDRLYLDLNFSPPFDQVTKQYYQINPVWKDEFVKPNEVDELDAQTLPSSIMTYSNTVAGYLTLEQIDNYLRTWSPYKRWLQKHPDSKKEEDPINQCLEKLRSSAKQRGEEELIKVEWPQVLIHAVKKK